MELIHSQSHCNIRPFTSKPKLKSNRITNNIPNQQIRPGTSIPLLKSKKTNTPTLSFKKPKALRPSSSAAGIIESRTNIDYRTVRPKSSYKDRMFNKYWKSTSIKPKGFDKEKLKDIINDKETEFKGNLNLLSIEKIMSGNRALYKYPHILWDNKNPTAFLGHVGGREFNYINCDTNITSRPPSTKPIGSNLIRPYTAYEKKTSKRDHHYLIESANKKSKRPTTAIISNQLYNKELSKSNVYADEDEDDEDEDDITNYPTNVKALIDNYQNISVKNFSIKTAQADTDLLEIFDRSQRTLAVTLARVGDYDYYTSCQRIGSFFDFSSHMKWKDLKNIEIHINQTKDNMLCYQSQHNIQPNNHLITASNSHYFNDPNSLFHGFMPYESDMLQIGKVNHVYDPIDFLPKYTTDDIFNEDLYQKDFIRNVTTSIANYNKYLDSARIKKSDLYPFNPSRLRRKVLPKLRFPIKGVFKEIVDSNMKEVGQLYYHTLKTIIMDYILRSPHERKRLNIKFFPRKALPSLFTIAMNGSFNRSIYSEWVDNYATAFNSIEKNLSLCNIAVSGLIDWSQSFNHINLFYIKKLHLLKSKDIDGLHIDDFCTIELSYLNKIKRFLKDIYYRGSVLIAKKNKALKRKDMPSQGRWTFKGFTPFKHKYNDDQYGMSYEDQLTDFWTNVDLNDLNDIRLTASNYCYVTYALGKQIDLDCSDYDDLSPDAKEKLNNSITTYCTIFLRKLTEKALNDFYDFIKSFASNEDILLKNKQDKINFSKELQYKDQDLRLPDLFSFKICHLVDPIISIRSKYEQTYNVIKLEYNFDQVYYKILQIIDTITSLFDSFCATHFLEFKKILPSERAKIAKEHSTKLNDFFNSDPNQNKSFLEEYYSSLCPSLILEEIDVNQYMKSYLKTINSSDLFVLNIKNGIYHQMKTQFVEIEECLNIFEPIREVYTNSLSESIKSFIETSSSMPDYTRCTEFIDLIRKYQRYISIIPNRLSYSMFIIDLRNTKRDLMIKLDNDMNLIMRTLEQEIISYYNVNINKYTDLIKMIDIKLSSPEDVVAMEKSKAKVSAELAIIAKDFDDSYKIFLYLLKTDLIFSNEIIAKNAEGRMKYYKFKEDQERVEKMHKANRAFIENKFKEEKKKIEEELDEFFRDINLLDNRTHITEYENLVATTEYYLEKIPPLKKRIDRNLKDEELLFEYRVGLFEVFDMCVSKITKLSVLWKNIQTFYDERRALIHNFNEDIDVPYYISLFVEINESVLANKQNLKKDEDIIGKLSKVLEEDIESLNNFLKITNEVILASYPINSVLKETVQRILSSKTMEPSCKDILFSIYSKKEK